MCSGVLPYFIAFRVYVFVQTQMCFAIYDGYFLFSETQTYPCARCVLALALRAPKGVLGHTHTVTRDFLWLSCIHDTASSRRTEHVDDLQYCGNNIRYWAGEQTTRNHFWIVTNVVMCRA